MLMPFSEIKSRAKALFRISAPVMAEQTFVMLMGIVSSILVAHIGEHAVSAVSMVDSISMLLISFFMALATGGTIVIAQYTGRQEMRKAKTAAGQAFVMSIVLAFTLLIVFIFMGETIINAMFRDAEPKVSDAAYRFLSIIIFSYPFLAANQTAFGIMRGSGNTRTPMFISILMNIINLVLGVILIRGLNLPFVTIPAFGVAGAAVALLVGRVSGFLLAMYHLTRRAKTMRLDKIKYFLPNLAAVKNILRFGIPSGVESSLFNLGKLLTMTFVVGLGTHAIAANAVGGMLLGITNIVASSFSVGIMVMCGKMVGAGETHDIKRTAHFAAVTASVLMALIGLVMFVLFNPIVSLYNVEADTIRYLRQILYTAFIVQIFLWPGSFLVPSVLRAAGDVKFTMLASIISMWALRIGLAYVFGVTLGFGLIGVWMGMFADWLGRGILFYRRLHSNKWMGKAIKD